MTDTNQKKLVNTIHNNIQLSVITHQPTYRSLMLYYFSRPIGRRLCVRTVLGWGKLE